MDAVTLTLLGYPLSIFANFTYDALKNIRLSAEDLTTLEKLYLQAFYKSIDQHNRYYDSFAKRNLKFLEKEVKKDEAGFLKIILPEEASGTPATGRAEYRSAVSKRIAEKYKGIFNGETESIQRIIDDCFKFYSSSFISLLNEKNGIQAVMMECLKLGRILDILQKIDENNITKEEFNDLRKIVLENRLQTDTAYKKTLKDYDDYLCNKFRYLELRGFSPKISGKEIQMELEDIFVPLSINEESNFEPNILNPQEENKNTEKCESFSILKHNYLVILGDPGSGKSTLLKYLAIQLSKHRQADTPLQNMIPVFFRLSDYSDYYKTQHKPLYDFITNFIDSQYQDIYKEGFEYSNLILFMDGLDEITDTSLRLRVTDQIMDLMARYPHNQYVITSRIVGYQEAKLGGRFKHFKLAPFTEKEIGLFAEQWYKSIARHTRQKAEEAQRQADTLCNSIKQNQSVLKLATNPLLMTIITMIHYQGKKLPNKRIELYEISTETFLEHWVQLRISDEKQLKDKAEIIEILAPIAFQIHDTKSNALIEEKEFEKEFLSVFSKIHTCTPPDEAQKTCKEFIRFLRQQTGFFYEKGVDDDGNRFYGFMHLTFEEYLAAIEFVSRWNQGQITLENYVFKPRWSEILRLAAAQIRLSLLGQGGRNLTTKFIKEILSANDPFPAAQRPLQLACLILSDEVAISDELYNNIIDKLLSALNREFYGSLSESLCNLLAKLVQSDKKKYIIEQIKERITKQETTFLINIGDFLSQYKDIPEIYELLKGNINNSIIRKEYFSNYFLNTSIDSSFTKKEFINYLLQNNGQAMSVNSRLSAVLFNQIMEGQNEMNFIKNLNQLLNKIDETTYKDTGYQFVIEILIISNKEAGTIKGIIKNLSKSHPHPFFKNIINHSNETICKLKGIEYNNFSVESIRLQLKNARGAIYRTSKQIYLHLWSSDFSRIQSFQSDIDSFNELYIDLQSNYAIEEFNLLKINIINILGPQKTPNDIEHLLRIYQSDIGLNPYRWGTLLAENVNKVPGIFPDIIIKNSLYFLWRKEDWKFPQAKDIPAPVKLLSQLTQSHSYEEAVLQQCIQYYNQCEDPKLKQGTFEIIYYVLNSGDINRDNIKN